MKLVWNLDSKISSNFNAQHLTNHFIFLRTYHMNLLVLPEFESFRLCEQRLQSVDDDKLPTSPFRFAIMPSSTGLPHSDCTTEQFSILWQWCLEGISFCHAHQYILFAAKFMTCVFSSNANAKLHSFSTFYCHFFLPQERSAISLTTCNWLQAIHFLELLFLSFRNGHFLRSNLISSCCVFVETQVYASQCQ